MANQDPDVTEVLQASGQPTLKRAAEQAQEHVDRLFKVSLHIAVTGETGAEKSFINVIRGLGDEDEGAAETGVAETTTQPTPYHHPTMPNVTFWNLPGIGSPNFKAKTYLKDVKFDTYDLFLIISSERFRESHIMLAKQILNMKKKVYFIRSKIDNDIRAEEGRKGFDREKLLSKIRANCQDSLNDFGNPQIFLISSKRLKDFDFERLCDAIISDLPSIKQSALLQSVPVSSMVMLEKKIRVFEKAAWAAALVSGAVAVAPVLGLSVACDTGILLAFFTRCYYSFGLDDKSLKKLSEQVNKPSLKHLIKSPLVLALASKSAARLRLSSLSGGAAVEYLCSLVPGVGSAVAAVVSFSLTHRLLRNGLKELADTARTVLTQAGLQ
ncbi:interferon-inducible GTPase 5-like isoform X1 [Brachyhypopomus gauderio]|uniref:interferon-inducible GTPase 5-like isoform X1 n=1 Tax=Brachyhypopomus gauderio TaxID=698409 RepID=UPI0040413300